MQATDTRYLNAFHAYRQVLLTQRKPGQTVFRKPYSDRFWDLIGARISGETYHHLKVIWDLSIEGLGHTRENDLERARECFDNARVWQRPEILCREAQLLAASVNNAAEAYLMYRLDRFDDAQAMVACALDADEELEREYGYELLIGHRIQLVHNTIRIQLRRQCFGRAYELLGAAIAFMEGYGKTIPLHHSWVPSRLQSDRDWNVMARQLTCELANASVHAPDSAWQSLCASLDLPRFLEEGHLDPISRDWIHLKHLLMSGETTAFLEHLPGFFEASFAESHVFFYVALIDFLQLLGKGDSSVSRALYVQLLRDSLKWVPPKSFLPVLDRERASIAFAEAVAPTLAAQT